MRGRTPLQLGVNVTAATAGAYATTALEHSLLQARTHGFDTVTLAPTWYLSTPRASDLAPDPVLTAGDPALEHAIAAARRQGLSVAIRPLVDLPGQYRWRSLIDPEDRDAWWERYRAMIEHYAGLAHRSRAATLVIGSELEGLTGAPADDASWRALAAAVRRRFAGALAYTTAVLEDPGVVRFWDELDYVGITLRPRLADDEEGVAVEPARSAAWAPYADALEQLHRRWSRPILVTELGFRSSERALSDPDSWHAADAPDYDRQALAYDGAYRLFEQLPWLAGVHWWEWPANLDSAAHDATGHCPYRKPAAAVATRWNRRLSPRREAPFVSVVVPVRNGADTIRDCIASLLAQQYPTHRREIIIVDNASTDATRSIIAALPVICVSETKIGRPHARNRGVVEARGEIVAFIDSDCVAAVDWLRELTAAFEREPVSAVAGEILAQTPVTAVQRFMAQREAQWQRHATTLPHPFRFAITANLAVRREVFDHIGSFDPRFVTAEDSDFGWRFFAAGLAMSYCPTGTVSHRLRRNAWPFIRQQEGLGYGRALLRERYGVPGRYVLPTNGEVGNATQALGRMLLGRQHRTSDELPFTLYELLRLVSLRAGSARRTLVSVFAPYRDA